MSTPHLSVNVGYGRRVQEASGEREISERVEILENEDHHTTTGLQKTGPCTLRNLSDVKRSHFRAIAVIVGVFYLLLLAGIFIRYILVDLQRDQLSTMYNQLKNRHDNLSNSFNISQHKVILLKEKYVGKCCPKGWMRFGCICYYNFSERKSLNETIEECKMRGGELMVLNSTEKQRISECEVDEEVYTELCG